MKNENLLPYLEKGGLVKADGRRIWSTPELVAAQLQLGTSFSLQTQMDANSCKLTTYSLSGCHSCARGAMFAYNCTTTFGTSLANVKCNSGLEFPVVCSFELVARVTTLYYGFSDVMDKCLLRCPTSVDEFTIDATLEFVQHTVPRQSTQNNSPFERDPIGLWTVLKGFLDAPKRLAIFAATLLVSLLTLYGVVVWIVAPRVCCRMR